MGDLILTLFLVSLFALMGEEDERKAGLVGRVEHFVLRLLIIQKGGGGIIIDGISTANRVIQREEGWRALWRRSQRQGSARPPDNACLRGRASGRQQRRLSASPAGSGRIPRASENPGLEEDAEL